MPFDALASLEAILPAGIPRQVEHARHQRSWKNKLLVRVGESRHVFVFFRRRRIAERFAALLRLLEQRGVIAQQVERSGPAPGRGGWHFVATTWLEGRSLEKDRLQDDAALGQALARVHAITSPKWGAFVHVRPLLRYGYRFEIMLDAVRAIFAMWRGDRALAGTLIATLRWLWPQTAVLGNMGEFHLIHGDVHRRNVLIGARGLGFLDYDEMMFDHRGFEVAACVYRLYATTPAGWAPFWAAYRSGIGTECATALDRAGALLFTIAGLRLARARVRRAPNRAERARKAQRYAKDLAHLRAAFPAGGGTMDAAAAVLHRARGHLPGAAASR